MINAVNTVDVRQNIQSAYTVATDGRGDLYTALDVRHPVRPD